jgi:hypothetical protein
MTNDNNRNVILFQLLTVIIMLLLGTLSLNAQLKVGSNPKLIAPNVLFEIETSLGKSAVFTKDSAFLGLGTLVPTRRLEIVNGSSGAIKIVDGTQGAGKVLTSDANGVGIWSTPFSASPQDLTNSNGIIINGGTGATFTTVSLRLDSTAIAKMVTQSPVKDSIIQVMNSATTNVLTAGSNAITNTTNGVVANLTPSAGSLSTKFLGFDASGNLVTDTAITIIPATTNTMTNTINTITSTVNGVVATAPAVNTVSNTFNTTTRELNTTVNGVTSTSVVIPSMSDSTSASNGLTLSGKDIQLGGSLSKATAITTTATNTLSIAGLQSGTLNDSLVVSDATTGTLKRLSTNALGDKTQANNGLSKSGDTVQLGGTLSKETTITQSNAKDSVTFATGGNKFKIIGLPSGSSSDSLLTLDGNNVVKKIPVSTITKQPFRVVVGSTLLTLADYTVVLNSTSTATFTLPAANTAKDKIFRIANYAYYSGNDIILSLPVKYGTDISYSVDDMYVGGGFFTSRTVSSISIQSDGTDWWFIGR